MLVRIYDDDNRDHYDGDDADNCRRSTTRMPSAYDGHTCCNAGDGDDSDDKDVRLVLSSGFDREKERKLQRWGC